MQHGGAASGAKVSSMQVSSCSTAVLQQAMEGSSCGRWRPQAVSQPATVFWPNGSPLETSNQINYTLTVNKLQTSKAMSGHLISCCLTSLHFPYEWGCTSRINSCHFFTYALVTDVVMSHALWLVVSGEGQDEAHDGLQIPL